MKSINSIETIPFDDDEIRKHRGYNKYINGLSNELVFELSRDLADPI